MQKNNIKNQEELKNESKKDFDYGFNLFNSYISV